MADGIELSVQRGHLVETTAHDDELRPTHAWVLPTPGYQFNGHRIGCRCETCRPDLSAGTPEVDR